MENNQLATESVNKAMKYLEENNHGRAFAHLLVALNLAPEMKKLLKILFEQTLWKFGDELFKKNRLEEYFNCYELGLEMFPNSIPLLHSLGDTLVKIKGFHSACGLYSKLSRLSPDNTAVQRVLDDLKNCLLERWHFRMLNDKIRNRAYKSAILKAVTPDDIVLDIGCGSGILSMFANENNPAEIIAVESSKVLYEIACTVFNDNNINNVKLLCSTSQELTLEMVGNVTTVVTEIFDSGLLGEGVLQTLGDTWQRLLQHTPGVRLIPKGASLYVCGIQSKILASKHRFIKTPSHVSSLLNFGDINIYSFIDEPYDTEDLTMAKDLVYVTDVVKLLDIDFYNFNKMFDLLEGKPFGNVALNPCVNEYIDAYVVWFDLHLDDEISITTDPRATDRADAWEQAIFHLHKPTACSVDSKINLEFTCKDGKFSLLHQNVDNADTNPAEYFEVSEDILGCLNGVEFLKAAENAAGAACIHLSQSMLREAISVLDLTPFPIVGLLLLSRCAHTLTCVEETKKEERLIAKFAQLNNIDMRQIRFIKKADDINKLTPFKYDAIINNFISNFGHLRSSQIDAARLLRIHNQNKNGIMMPYNFQMMARLIYCDEINRTNLVNDNNVCGYKIAESLNLYQVSQISVSGFSSVPCTRMSEDIVVYDSCIEPLENCTINVDLVNSGPVNAVISWFRVQLIENGVWYSTDSLDSRENCVIHMFSQEIEGNARDVVEMMVFHDANSGFFKIAVEPKVD